MSDAAKDEILRDCAEGESAFALCPALEAYFGQLQRHCAAVEVLR